MVVTVDHADKLGENALNRWPGEGDDAAVEVLGGEGLHFELGDDAKVVETALEGLEEIGVGAPCGFDDDSLRDAVSVQSVEALTTGAGNNVTESPFNS